MQSKMTDVVLLDRQWQNIKNSYYLKTTAQTLFNPSWETKQSYAVYHRTNNPKRPKNDLGNCVMTMTLYFVYVTNCN